MKAVLTTWPSARAFRKCSECLLENVVRQGQRGETCTRGRDLGVGGKQSAVVGRDTPLGVAVRDRLPQSANLAPVRVAPRDRRALVNGGGEFLRLLFERTTPIGVVVAVRKQVAVLGVGDEQLAEQDRQRHRVGAVDFVPRARCGQATLIRDSVGEGRDHLLVDSLAQLRREISREAVGILQNLGEATTRREGVGGEQKP